MRLTQSSKLFVIAFSALVVATTVPFSAAAQQKSVARPFVIAVIDMKRTQRDAAAAKDIQRQMDARRAMFQSRVQQEEAKLRTAYQDLTQKQGVLSKEAFEAERRKFEDSKVAAQRTMQGFRGELEKASARARDIFIAKRREVVQKLVESKGITLLLRKDQLIYTDSNYEVTDYVIKALDKVLPTVKVFGPEAEKK